MADSYNILDLSNYNFYIGGLPTSVEVTLDQETLKELRLKSIEILTNNNTTNINNHTIRKSLPVDLIYVLENYEIAILKPDCVNNKQGSKTRGIIVCQNCLVHKYNKDTKSWASMTLSE
ncbi:hypothetical protein HgNV_012 [Homarus gammarus nudivirus]|uniref:Uncharacterized protein n=1 Tax=Homarus gammarus nudivirus TaxID=2509616 RepID=A0A411HB63_9VIRU|nr:hypothetical protein KM727_gp12 [Homarus gammarus nudivirus]QBB28617.1 hypothetical protein HgNV_012 [Homarus gammarus nudivirus]